MLPPNRLESLGDSEKLALQQPAQFITVLKFVKLT